MSLDLSYNNTKIHPAPGDVNYGNTLLGKTFEIQHLANVVSHTFTRKTHCASPGECDIFPWDYVTWMERWCFLTRTPQTRLSKGWHIMDGFEKNPAKSHRVHVLWFTYIEVFINSNQWKENYCKFSPFQSDILYMSARFCRYLKLTFCASNSTYSA